MNETKLFPDQSDRISEQMRLARLFDGRHFWNTATEVRGLYTVTRWARLRMRLTTH